jgi:hypothetical protein
MKGTRDMKEMFNIQCSMFNAQVMFNSSILEY